MENFRTKLFKLVDEYLREGVGNTQKYLAGLTLEEFLSINWVAVPRLIRAAKHIVNMECDEYGIPYATHKDIDKLRCSLDEVLGENRENQTRERY